MSNERVIEAVVWQGVAVRDFQSALQSLENAISATPSGPQRNLLTEANIHMMMAQDALKKAFAPVSPEAGA